MRQENVSIYDIGQIDYGSHGSAVFFPICMKAMSEYLEEDRQVLQQAVSVLERWMERFYARDIRKYETWQDMLLQQSWNALHADTGLGNAVGQSATSRKEESLEAAQSDTDKGNAADLACDTYGEDNPFVDTADNELFSRLLAQGDDIQCLVEDRSQEAKYLLELAARQKKRDNLHPEQLELAARHLQKVSAYAEEIRYLIGDWPDLEAMLRHLTDRRVQKELAQLLLYAKTEDEAALQCIKAYLR